MEDLDSVIQSGSCFPYVSSQSRKFVLKDPQNFLQVLVLRLQHDDLRLGGLLRVLQGQPVFLFVDRSVPLGSGLELQDQVQHPLLGVKLLLNLKGCVKIKGPLGAGSAKLSSTSNYASDQAKTLSEVLSLSVIWSEVVGQRFV